MIVKRAFMSFFLVSASAVLGLGQTDDFWLIKESKGTWEYRIGQGEPRQLTGKYDCLRPAGELRCMEKDIRRCELRYLIESHSDKTEKLGVRPVTGRWVSLKNLKPPAAPVLPPAATDLVPKLKRLTQVGGSRSGSGCGGDFLLKAPACGDTVDITDFKLRWTTTGEDGNKKISIVIEKIDGQMSRFRRTAPAASGEYADDELLRFLKGLQGRNNPVDITVRVMADNGRSAIRLVHIPPSVRMDLYESRVREINSPDIFLKSFQLMSLALDESMWSKAAEEACKLMELAPGAPELQEYALAGLCQSDFEDEKSRLRRELTKERYEGICSAPGTAAVEIVAEIRPSNPPVEAPKPAERGQTRLGIALLIGNSDYWNLPLNSVKSDLKSMSETLEGLGFKLMVKENLRNPKQFQDALDEIQKKENASPEDVLLVYYSGHGLQLDGKAHLLGTGVSATARVAEDVRSNAKSAQELLEEMERATPGSRILIVEACRDNLFGAPSDSGSQSPRGGFAFNQDDVPNTIVMFANKPGLPAPARSDTGLMGPFTEALIDSLLNSSGEIQEVFELAKKKTGEISPGQEPVMYASKKVDRIVMRQQEAKFQSNRAVELLNGAETLYHDKVWDQFLLRVERVKSLASANSELQLRSNREVEFARLVMAAQKEEEKRNWKEAALLWQKSGEVFPARQWVTKNAAVAWLMGDDLNNAVQSLAMLSAQSDGELALQAKQILGELIKTFPELEAEASKKAQDTPKLSAMEFELVKGKE